MTRVLEFSGLQSIYGLELSGLILLINSIQQVHLVVIKSQDGAEKAEDMGYLVT